MVTREARTKVECYHKNIESIFLFCLIIVG